MSADRRIAALRRLAASTTFPGERESALKKAAELEARGKPNPFAEKGDLLGSMRTIFDPVPENGEPLEVDTDPLTGAWPETAYQRYWARRTGNNVYVHAQVRVDTTMFDFAMHDLEELFKTVQAQRMRDIASAFGVSVDDLRSTDDGYEVDVP